MKNKLKTAFTLLVYIAVTVGIYALICHLNHQPFDDLRILYAVLIGCVAYLPRHLMVSGKVCLLYTSPSPRDA